MLKETTPNKEPILTDEGYIKFLACIVIAPFFISVTLLFLIPISLVFKLYIYLKDGTWLKSLCDISDYLVWNAYISDNYCSIDSNWIGINKIFNYLTHSIGSTWVILIAFIISISFSIFWINTVVKLRSEQNRK